MFRFFKSYLLLQLLPGAQLLQEQKPCIRGDSMAFALTGGSSKSRSRFQHLLWDDLGQFCSKYGNYRLIYNTFDEKDRLSKSLCCRG